MKIEIFDIRTFTPTTYTEALSRLPKARQAEITSSARHNSPQLRVAGETLARKMLALESGLTPEEIVIKKEVVDPEDVEMLQDLVLTAVNEALRKADDMMQEGLGGLNIPGLM